MATDRYHLELYSPAGLFIGFCNGTKYDWYLRKGIATQIDDRKLRLHFEPSFEGEPKCEIVDREGKVVGLCSQHQSDRYLSEGSVSAVSATRVQLLCEGSDFTSLIPVAKRSPQCAICAGEEELSKCHLLPGHLALVFIAQRRFEQDFMFLCIDCAHDVRQWGNTRLEYVLREHKVTATEFVDPDKKTTRNLARKILRAKRKGIDFSGWSESLKRILGTGHLTDETLAELSHLDVTVERDGSCTAYEHVVNRLRAQGKFADFLQRWQRDFVTEFAPSYLSFCYSESFIDRWCRDDPLKGEDRGDRKADDPGTQEPEGHRRDDRDHQPVPEGRGSPVEDVLVESLVDHQEPELGHDDRRHEEEDRQTLAVGQILERPLLPPGLLGL